MTNSVESISLQQDIFEVIERLVQRRISHIQQLLHAEKRKLLSMHPIYVDMAMSQCPEWDDRDAEEFVNESTEMMIEDKREDVHDTIETILAWGEYLKMTFLNWQEGREPNSARNRR